MDCQFSICQSDKLQACKSCTILRLTSCTYMQIAFHIWVHLDVGAKQDFTGLTPEVWQLGAVGAVRVAVRGLSASGSLLRPSQ
jgi:hypothetical protein